MFLSRIIIMKYFLPLINNGYYVSSNYIIKIVEKRLTLYKYNEIIENVNQRYGYEFMKAEKKSYSPYSLAHTTSTYGKL
jgi:hypothetical protein